MDFRYWLLTAVVVTFLGWFDVGKTSPPKEMVIAGDWMFKTGDNSNWKNQSTQDADWSFIRVPAVWEGQGYPDYDGIAWYRKHLQIPADWEKAAGIIFDIGKIDDDDEVFFNGQSIGASTGWQTYRKYAIPKELVRFDQDNVIAIRVNDGSGGGGLWEGPVKLVTGVVARYGSLDADAY
ncbi:MAG: beta galactosidase jelly roll domain-containing protein [Elusimicrobiota bacterium]